VSIVNVHIENMCISFYVMEFFLNFGAIEKTRPIFEVQWAFPFQLTCDLTTEYMLIRPIIGLQLLE